MAIGIVAAACAVLMMGAVSLASLAAGRRESGGAGEDGWNIAAMALALLLALVNLNLWVPGKQAWGAIAAVALAAAVAAAWRARGSSRKPRWPVIAAATAVSAVLAFVWLRLFGGSQLWLGQGDNNDLLYFFVGSHWAVDYPLRVSQAFVADNWKIGNCAAGAAMVGTHCMVYRSGTYTLLAPLLFGVADASPNVFRAALGLIGSMTTIAFLPLAGGAKDLRVGRIRLSPLWAGSLLALGAGLSTAVVGSVANANIATAAGCAALTMLAAWAFAPSERPWLKALMLGLGAALSAHLYGEAAAYGCVVAALGVCVDAYRRSRWSWVFAGGCITLAAFALGANVVLVELYESFKIISGLVAQNSWPSWYMHKPVWFWLAAPFAGFHMDGPARVYRLEFGLGCLLALSAALLSARRNVAVLAVGLATLSAAMVFYLERAHYEYGEHKIVQMLGAIWWAYLLAVSYWTIATAPRSENGQGGDWRPKLAWAALIVQALLAGYFLFQAKRVVVDRMPARALSAGFGAPLDKIKDGDEVVLDRSAGANLARFSKQDYLTAVVHIRGGRALLSDGLGDPVQPYTQASRVNSLRGAKSPDWLARIKSDDVVSVFNAGLPAVQDNDAFAFVDLRDGAVPFALAGTGWYGCEKGFCWTNGAYTVESFMPPRCGSHNVAALTIHQDFYAPPPGATLEVSVNGLPPVRYPAQEAKRLVIPIPHGWSVAQVRPDWEIKSPQQVVALPDARPLFASVSRVEVRCR